MNISLLAHGTGTFDISSFDLGQTIGHIYPISDKTGKETIHEFFLQEVYSVYTSMPMDLPTGKMWLIAGWSNPKGNLKKDTLDGSKKNTHKIKRKMKDVRVKRETYPFLGQLTEKGLKDILSVRRVPL